MGTAVRNDLNQPGLFQSAHGLPQVRTADPEPGRERQLIQVIAGLQFAAENHLLQLCSPALDSSDALL
jgi:hypothetical protein